MALKKGVFQDYIKKQESSELKELIEKKKQQQYTHNKVFSNPSFNTSQPEQNKNLKQTAVKTHNKPQSKLETNHTQNPQQTTDKNTALKGSEKQTGDKVYSKPTTNGKQTSNDLSKDITFANLSGLQRDIVLTLYENCQILGGRVTQELSLEYLSKKTKGKKLSIKTSILRLKHKNYVKQVGFKNGRGGWTKYELHKQLHADIIHYYMYSNKTLNGEQTSDKLHSQPIAQPTSSASSSNSNINNTTTICSLTELDNNWKMINTEPLKDIGFSLNNLRQLINLNNVSVVQDSIYKFAYTLKHNQKAQSYKNPLNVIMGVLRKGEAWSEPNYESPQDRALRELYERKKTESEKRNQMRRELGDLMYPDWKQKLTPDEILTIAPKDKALNTSWDNSTDKLLRDHFDAEVLPKLIEEHTT